jgi:hypothetical protein
MWHEWGRREMCLVLVYLAMLFVTGANKTITNIGIHFQYKTNICFQELIKYQQLRIKETQNA